MFKSKIFPVLLYFFSYFWIHKVDPDIEKTHFCVYAVKVKFREQNLEMFSSSLTRTQTPSVCI